MVRNVQSGLGWAGHGRARHGEAGHGRARQGEEEKMVKTVKLESLVLDYNFYPRTQVSDEHTGYVKEAILAGRKLPPIVADKNSLRIIDGFHRYQAYKRLGIEEVEVDLRGYKSEAEMLEDAVRLNANHGRPFATQDRRRVILRAEELGLSRDKVAEILNITREKVEKLAVQRAFHQGEAVPLKRGLLAAAGQQITEKQRKANEKWGGMSATFYARQLLIYLESDFMVTQELAEIMDALTNLWQEKREILLADAL